MRIIIFENEQKLVIYCITITKLVKYKSLLLSIFSFLVTTNLHTGVYSLYMNYTNECKILLSLM